MWYKEFTGSVNDLWIEIVVWVVHQVDRFIFDVNNLHMEGSPPFQAGFL